jgi:hypothetical protein
VLIEVTKLVAKLGIDPSRIMVGAVPVNDFIATMFGVFAYGRSSGNKRKGVGRGEGGCGREYRPIAGSLITMALQFRFRSCLGYPAGPPRTLDSHTIGDALCKGADCA